MASPSAWASTSTSVPARKRDWDKYTFGVYGCWVMGDDGNLSYVNEDDYTDEMWNEQKKAGLRAFTHQR